MNKTATLTLITACLLSSTVALFGQEPSARKAEGIQDNSFLVEEAYNQEPGIVQHILNVVWSVDKLGGPDDREWSLVFTQEWPLFSQTHQLSYTVPYRFLETGGQSDNGIEDVLLNYRFQALTETDTQAAFAPRFSLIVPAGDEEQGFGNDTLGYQFNLPFSKILSDSWTAHFNAGLTVLPDVKGHDLVSYNLGASAIYAVMSDFNLMLEWVANWDEEVDDTGRLGRPFSVVISPGARYAYNFANHTQLVLGIGVPVGLTAAAPDYGVFLYVSFEHPFRQAR